MNQRAIAKLDLIRQEELARKKRQRARWSRRQSELRWVKDRHPGLRVAAEQPKVWLPVESLTSCMIADYAAFDEGGSLKAIYEFGSLSCPNKFHLWAQHFPSVEIYWIPAVLSGDESMAFAAIRYR